MEKQIKHAIQDQYPNDVAYCYGCGRLNDDGHHFRTGWEGDQTVTYFKPEAEHTAIPGFVYGGLIASLIDCHGTGSASLALHRKNGHEPLDDVTPPRFVTASLEVKYLKPTPIEATLKAVGTIEEIHPKKFKVIIEVFADDVQCASGEVIAAVMPEGFGK
ncbi:thioesterase [Halalkalibacillus sediminis]|uniref:Thioesterase n=1 Tax=Halalkalibacillus sediminis TaxID=2018042 RepID=A0A2I0QS14_9BACI|nr:PaaI family thioesterase [Halalkalibacillus sediminis]PKR77121.1 thioesterase [Halalkalibacillus sediminis]